MNPSYAYSQNTIMFFECVDFLPPNFVSFPWKLDNPYLHTLCKIGKLQLLIAEEIGLPDVDCCKAQINYCTVTLKSLNGCLTAKRILEILGVQISS